MIASIPRSELTDAILDGCRGPEIDVAGEVAAVGVTNQRATTVLWDAATGAPVAANLTSPGNLVFTGANPAVYGLPAGSGVGVTYLAPRFTRTAFNRSTVTRRASVLKMGQDEPQAVAARVIRAIERDERDRYLGWPEKLFVRINAIWPRLVDRSLASQLEKMRPFAAEAGH